MISGGFCFFCGGFPVITLFHTNQFVLVDINHEYMILKVKGKKKRKEKKMHSLHTVSVYHSRNCIYHDTVMLNIYTVISTISHFVM